MEYLRGGGGMDGARTGSSCITGGGLRTGESALRFGGAGGMERLAGGRGGIENEEISCCPTLAILRDVGGVGAGPLDLFKTLLREAGAGGGGPRLARGMAASGPPA